MALQEMSMRARTKSNGVLQVAHHQLEDARAATTKLQTTEKTANLRRLSQRQMQSLRRLIAFASASASWQSQTFAKRVAKIAWAIPTRILSSPRPSITAATLAGSSRPSNEEMLVSRMTAWTMTTTPSGRRQ